MNYYFDPEHTFFTSDTHFNHANIIRLCDRLQYLYPTQYDVGVDNNNFTPVSFSQVKQIINKQMEDHNMYKPINLMPG